MSDIKRESTVGYEATELVCTSVRTMNQHNERKYKILHVDYSIPE
jgi:hypothetical protein